MTRPPRKPHAVYVPPPPDPQLSHAQLDEIADRVLAGDVYQSGSVPECTALLAVLHERGYVLKHRTANEINAAPWLLIVVEEAQIVTPSTIEMRRADEVRHPATAQADPLRGGNNNNA